MKHKKLSLAQRERNGRNRERRLRLTVAFNPKDMSARQGLRIVHSEMRQRAASAMAKMKPL
jgi:hypothetical protein